MEKGKLTKGRQKIEMKPIRNENARQVCFSKRRSILFQKASELTTLCGGEVAVITFSPGGNCFSFGNPSVYSVADRFFNMPTLYGHAFGGMSHGGDGVTNRVREMNQELTDLQQLMEIERQRKEKVQDAIEKESEGCVMRWLNEFVGSMGIEELHEFQKELSVVQDMVFRNYEMHHAAMKSGGLPPQSPMNTALTSPVLLDGQREKIIHNNVPSSFEGPLEEHHASFGVSPGGGNYFDGLVGGNFFNRKYGGNFCNGHFGG
ncbi:hypothetical protein ACP4OV_026971 [Aristida adscensionis]